MDNAILFLKKANRFLDKVNHAMNCVVLAVWAAVPVLLLVKLVMRIWN